MKKAEMTKRLISVFLIISLFTGNLYGCAHVDSNAVSNKESEIDTKIIADSISEQIQNGSSEFVATEQEEKADIYTITDVEKKKTEAFVYDKIYQEYSMVYDTFDAVVKLSDGTELYGIAYSDFSCYFETEDKEKGYFPAGFIVNGGDKSIPSEDKEKGLIIENLEYQDDRYEFVLTYNTGSFYEHCVRNGKYIKYGIDENGIITYSEEDYSKDICDMELGALYSFDENKYIYDPDVGDYMYISGESLFTQIDYKAVENEINSILEAQDRNFSNINVESTVNIAKEAVSSYLLSLQIETFVGCDVDELIEEVKHLDASQCVRITPEGKILIDVGKDIPDKPSELARWTVGISCGIIIIGGTALSLFYPETISMTSYVTGAAIEVFMQVVIDNNSIENINWTRVSVAATTASLLAWVAPVGASAIAEKVGEQTGNVVLSKLAGYGFSTFSNAFIIGETDAIFAMIDGKSEEEVLDAFYTGAAMGACLTIGCAALGELGAAGMKTLKNSEPQNWLVKLSDGMSAFVDNNQVRFFSEDVDKFLAPKSVYEASYAGVREYNLQRAGVIYSRGGTYNSLREEYNATNIQAHEIPSFDSTGEKYRYSVDSPAIAMPAEDHRLTASFGSSKEAQEYREIERQLISQGNYHDAIQMGIDDLHLKFGNKYDEGISQMIEAAIIKGWW